MRLGHHRKSIGKCDNGEAKKKGGKESSDHSVSSQRKPTVENERVLSVSRTPRNTTWKSYHERSHKVLVDVATKCSWQAYAGGPTRAPSSRSHCNKRVPGRYWQRWIARSECTTSLILRRCHIDATFSLTVWPSNHIRRPMDGF